MWKEVSSDQKSKLENVPFTLYCYKARRNAHPPKFFDQDSSTFLGNTNHCRGHDYLLLLHETSDAFSKLCSVQADLSNLPLQPIPKGNGIEGEFYRVKYSVVLLFNSAELKAHIRWEEVSYTVMSMEHVCADDLSLYRPEWCPTTVSTSLSSFWKHA